VIHGDDVDADRIVLLADPRIARVPVVDCGEPLVDAREATEIAVDERQADAAGVFAQLRPGALDRLVRAQRLLRPGWQLVLVEGYRQAPLQRRYFDEYVATLRRANPQWTSARLVEMASRYIAPVEVAPHITGGAVDVTLAGPAGAVLWMGTEVNATPEESDGASRTYARNISPDARRNRILLGEVMTAAGFVNYPTEWWHWSVGDRYWAFRAGAPTAYYGPVAD
jgi:D-alanyl-D-alanine dipeptidase